MNKKLSLGVTISLIAIACAITFVVTMTTSLNMYNRKIAGVQQREEIYTKMEEVDSFVRSNAIAAIDEEILVESIMNGYMDGIDDDYAKYYSASEYYKKQQIESGTLIGTGIVAVRDESGYVRVESVYAGSPAYEQSVVAGDIITAVNAVSVLEIGAETAINQLTGDEGTKLTLTIQRGGQDITKIMVRRSFTISTVSGRLVDNYGYIRISGFNSLTADRFSTRVDELLAQEVSGFVIDLRDVSSTYYGAASGILNRLMSESVAATVIYKDGTEKVLVSTTSEQSVNKPIVVLVNENTSGPGELIAVTLRDYKGAVIVGANTKGRCRLSEIKSFKDGSAVEVTTAEIKPMSSDSYEGTGIKPEYAVDMGGAAMDTEAADLSSTNDPQVKKAFEVILTLKQNTADEQINN